ncbi:chloroplast light harvesting protein, partial [Pelagophyceae sp. CCMP2097]
MMSAATPPEPVAAPPPPPPPPKFDIKKLPGVTAPFGYFDPLGIAADKSEARVKYFRESELKHCRVAMLAAAGFLVAEVFHPLFGGNIDVPSYLAFQETPLQTFWPIVVLYIGVIEVFSVFTFESPFDGNLWTLKANRVPGDFEFDPLDLKPPGKADSFDMETKELNNGRLAMIAIAGMVAQEVIFKGKLF